MLITNRVYYFDVSKKGKDLLGTKDIPMLINEQAVKEEIYNLFHTQPGSIPMFPDKGIDLDRYLFEPIDDFTAEMMRNDIEIALKKYISRISNINILVIPEEENETYIINLNYEVTFTNSQQSMVLDFKKIR